MDYTIFSVDDSRQRYTTRIRQALPEWNDLGLRSIDGRKPELLALSKEHFPYDIRYNARVGQLGIWYGVLIALNYAPIVTFEDDAILGENFLANFESRIKELPDDADFFSLFLPRDSDHMYSPDKEVSYSLCKTYQRYGGVSMYYTKQGAEKIKALLERDGITGQYDDTLYHYSKTGELNGYCSKPSFSDLVFISGLEESIVQETDYL